MGFQTTDKCFFTGQDVISQNEDGGSFLDGYYYRISINSQIRTIKLSDRDDWQNDFWVKEYGHSFIMLNDSLDNWSFFERAKTVEEIINYYHKNSNKL